MKTYQEFIIETKKYTRTRSREEAEKIRQSQENPSLYRLKNRQTTETPYWGLEPKQKQKDQRQRRSANLRALTQKELEDHAKRNLYPSPKKTANRALKIERGNKKGQKVEVQTQTQKTGREHNVGHIVPQPNRRPKALRSRFQAIHPGDAYDNRTIEGGRENRENNSKNTKSTLTRSSVIRKALERANK